jgi:hypothetical protein
MPTTVATPTDNLRRLSTGGKPRPSNNFQQPMLTLSVRRLSTNQRATDPVTSTHAQHERCLRVREELPQRLFMTSLRRTYRAVDLARIEETWRPIFISNGGTYFLRGGRRDRAVGRTPRFEPALPTDPAGIPRSPRRGAPECAPRALRPGRQRGRTRRQTAGRARQHPGPIQALPCTDGGTPESPQHSSCTARSAIWGTAAATTRQRA